uniref:Uncharacterized protein n=1 Tax=Romanomermis culicivorax TaxID=13658 RepID=A0A915HFC8_ROMCU
MIEYELDIIAISMLSKTTTDMKLYVPKSVFPIHSVNWWCGATSLIFTSSNSTRVKSYPFLLKCVTFPLTHSRVIPEELIQSAGERKQHQPVDEEKFENIDDHSACKRGKKPKHKKKQFEILRRKGESCTLCVGSYAINERDNYSATLLEHAHENLDSKTPFHNWLFLRKLKPIA